MGRKLKLSVIIILISFFHAFHSVWENDQNQKVL